MTITTKIRVIAAIVDSQQLTLYKEDGQTIIIPQGDERLAKIIKIITPILAAGPGNIAEIDLTQEAVENTYRDFEQQTKGKVSFFKLAKSKLAGFLGIDSHVERVSPQTIGVLRLTKSEQLLAVTQEIIKHAQPVSSPDFHDRDVGTKGDATIVAVVDNKVIGGVEQLKPQFKHAVKNSDSKGMIAFMERVTKVAAKRQHSADDLLKFLKRGDLPIADDGSIIIYKVLARKGGSNDTDTFVDCHTRKVTQRVGSYVVMDESLVDPNRHNECSSGLHVARRSYVGSFYGDVCVLAKVHPEDVIAVPTHDANKMRVCGYHILFRLSDEAFNLLRRNQAFTDNEEAQLLLGRALAGDHDEPIEEVRITGQMGGGVIITPCVKVPTPLVTASEEKEIPTKPTKAAPKAAKALPEEKETLKKAAPKVDPKAVVKQVVAVKAAVEGRKDKAIRLNTAFLEANKPKTKLAAAQALLEFKKASKVGWETLGLKPDTGDRLKFVIDGEDKLTA